MNFGRIIEQSCVNTVAPPDSRCSDPAFALSNPDICGVQPALIIKPAVALTCAMGSIQFKAFTTKNGAEVDVTADTVFSSADMNVAMVGASTGNATAMAAGQTTISATYQGMTAQASFTVLSGDTCCQQQHVAMLMLVDITKSMSQQFSINYANKLAFAVTAARKFADGLDLTKDTIGLSDFHGTSYDILADISNDTTALDAALEGLSVTQDQTEFYDALSAAISQLATVSADRKVIVLISDGDDTLTGSFDSTNDPITLLNAFKEQGGIVICLGTRASGQGFSLLSAMASGGFFINAYPEVEDQALNYFTGIKGYICAGDCTPTGDVKVGKGELDYTSFINWNIDSGNVNLLGNGFFDYVPNNGLYVELTGATAAFGNFNGRMLSRNPFPVSAGDVYRLTVWLAGNQRLDKTPYNVRVQVTYKNSIGNAASLLDQTITVNDYTQDFHAYPFSFTATLDTDVRISIQQVSYPAGSDQRIGVLLGEVKFENTTDLSLLLDDDFDDENETYVPPKCGQGTTWVWLPNLNAYGYDQGYGCYGTTCLDEPPGVQTPDPNPLTDIESGTAPPPSGTTFSSTKTVCVTCPTGSQQLTPLIPAMTGYTQPSGTASASSEFTTPGLVFGLAWQAFSRYPNTQGWATLDGLTTGWIKYQFPSPQTVSSYSLKDIGETPAGQVDPWGPKDWTFEGSNDGTNWTVLDTERGVSWISLQSRTFPLFQPATFSFFRLNITANNGARSVGLMEFQVYGLTATPPPQACSTKTATSTVSQADADAKATAAATAAAQAQLNCQSVFTSTQQYTATCGIGTYGNPNSVTKSATATSSVSQEDADQQALAAAKAAAEAALSCNASNNAQAITLNAAGWNQPFMAEATPCPTVRFVPDAGTISNVTVSIFNLQSCINGDSFIIYLRAPDGTLILLYYSHGTSKPVNGPINITFDDAGGDIPNDGSPLASGTFKPFNGGNQPGLIIPPPAPNGPFQFALSNLIGMPKAGSWSLWVGQRMTQASAISNGWDLTIT